MLLEFSVSNFRSIKEMQTLSFVATAMIEHEATNVFKANEKTRLLKSVGIYGANGSGKSNLIKAIGAMLGFIKSPFDLKQKFQEQIQPFRFNTVTRNEGSFFQIMFMLEGKNFRYGFVYHKGTITSEWLFGTATKNEVFYFTREGQDIDINKERFGEALGLEKKTRANNLFLNVINEFNGALSSSICNYLRDIWIIKGLNNSIEDNFLKDMSIDALKKDETKEKLLLLMQVADMDLKGLSLRDDDTIKNSVVKKFGKKGIAEIENAESENDIVNAMINIPYFTSAMESVFMGADFMDEFTKYLNPVLSKQDIFDEYGNKGTPEFYDFNEYASEGTKKLFSYAGIILAYLKNDGIIIIDEFGSKLHTLLTKAIIKLFNSEENKAAQLCFVTHDINLLDKDLLRRDQVYLTEKNLKGETSLYSLAEIKAVRNDASFEKDYIKGKYGAIPFVKNLNSIFE